MGFVLFKTHVRETQKSGILKKMGVNTENNNFSYFRHGIHFLCFFIH